MGKKVVGYLRVSSEEQNFEDKVSIQEQKVAITVLCERNGWNIAAWFIDDKDYIATHKPKKGKKVNPSAARTDRPGLLTMLELVRTGTIDAIVCNHDDRLYRHERVVTAIKDAIEEGEEKRLGKEIEIWQVSGLITKDFMYLQAMMWRKENERRKERFAMGRMGTLKEGRWPGPYHRLGYTLKKEEGRRGHQIVLATTDEVQTVRDIFTWYDSGIPVLEIRSRLIAEGRVQKGRPGLKHPWTEALIYHILWAQDYTGQATWTFENGTAFTIEIPQIISPEQWKRVQERISRNKVISRRNTKWVYLLQGIAVCGECEARMFTETNKYFYKTLADGTKKRYENKGPIYNYRCNIAEHYPEEGHPRPYIFGGKMLDWAVWRHLVDQVIKKPETITDQIVQRQTELQVQGDSLDGDIAKAKQKLVEIDQQRAFYQRQAAKKTITEFEFDARMEETKEAKHYWLDEISRLQELRDDATMVQVGLDHVIKLMTTFQERLAEVDIAPDEFKRLSQDDQQTILLKRQTILRTICDKVYVHANGQIRLEGAFDGNEVSQFALGNNSTESANKPQTYQMRLSPAISNPASRPARLAVDPIPSRSAKNRRLMI